MNSAIEHAAVIDFRVRVPLALCPEVAVPAGSMSQYDAVLDLSGKSEASRTLDDLFIALDNSGVDHAVIHAENEHGDVADDLNRTVADIVEKYPQRLTGIGTISLAGFGIKKALHQIEYCAEMGMIGLSLEPAFFGMAIDDKRLYPVYAKSMEKNMLVAIHTGINYSTNYPMGGERPLLLDEIACAFPDLTIVASHAGWPWIAEMVAVARKHPNVHMEFGALAPRYVGASGSGWEMMYRFMNSVLSKQVLFGTDWPLMDHRQTLAEWRDLGLKPAVLEGLLVENAKALIVKHSTKA
jgi:predicted TIM-barrel fold metal-dependent hydrolase